MPRVEFELWLKDLTKGTFSQIGGNSRKTFGGIDKDVANTKRGLESMAQEYKLRVDTSALERANREADRLSEKMGGFGGGGGKGIAGGVFLGGLATQGIMMAGREAMDAGRSAWDNGVQLENMKVGLQTFVGNRANEIVEGVLKQADYTPFTTASLLPIEMGFIATGMTPERSNKDMMNIANAVAATGGNDFILNRIGSDMMGAAAKGTIGGRELMELQRTGHINIESLVAKDLFPKMPMEKSLKRVEDMDITFKEFESALDRASQKGGMFAGALERLSQTVGGKASTIKDKWWHLTAELMMSQNGPIKRIEDGIINGLSDIPGILAKATPVFDKIFDTLDELWPSMKAFGGGLWDLLKPIGGILVSSEFTSLAKSVLDVATDITTVLKPAIIEASSLLKGAFGGVSKLIDDITGKNKKPNTWHWGDPIFESKQEAMHRELHEINPLMQKILGYNAPFFESRKHLGQRAMWSAMPDLGFGAAKAHESFLSYDAHKWTLGGNNDKNKMSAPVKAATPDITSSDAITSGGPRQINIYAHFMEHARVTVENSKDGVKQLVGLSREEFYKLLLGLPGIN